MIEDIIVDLLEDGGAMDAHVLLDRIMSGFDCTEDETIEALNRLYDAERIRAWSDDGVDYMVGLP